MSQTARENQEPLSKFHLFKRALALQAAYGDYSQDMIKKNNITDVTEDSDLVTHWKKLNGLSRHHSMQLLKSEPNKSEKVANSL